MKPGLNRLRERLQSTKLKISVHSFQDMPSMTAFINKKQKLQESPRDLDFEFAFLLIFFVLITCFCTKVLLISGTHLSNNILLNICFLFSNGMPVN